MKLNFFLGFVVAMDTGSMVKGKYRFDYAVFDKDYAFKLGRKKWNVYLVKDDASITMSGDKEAF